MSHLGIRWQVRDTQYFQNFPTRGTTWTNAENRTTPQLGGVVLHSTEFHAVLD